MPRKSPTICNAVGCSQLTYDGYCSKHKHDVDRDYSQYRTDVKEQTFYKSLAWKKLREYKRNINPLCQHCLSNGIATPMDVADHIEEIKDNWSRRLDLSNLMSLCYSCHNKKTQEVKKNRRY